MRQFILPFLFFLALTPIIAQSVAINNDGTVAHASAILDVKSTTLGFLAPRMTTIQRVAIAAPAAGLLVYDTDLGTYFYRNASTWQAVNIVKSLADADGDTKIQVEETANDNVIRFDISGDERMTLQENASGILRLEIKDALLNTFIGSSSGLSNTTGTLNTGIGNNALKLNTTGIDNLGIGNNALTTNTTGSSNIGIGTSALRFNTTGQQNLAIGPSALFANTTGLWNLGIGSGALFSNTTGFGNLGLGLNALLSNTTGNANLGFGIKSVYSNTTGSENIGIGGYSLYNNSTGFYNVALGDHVLYNNTTSNGNTAIGSNAMFSNTTGAYNTAMGYYSLSGNTTGAYNIAFGSTALQGNTTGLYNVGLGQNALKENTTSIRNVAIGDNAGMSFQHSDGNTFIGAATSATAAGYTNSTALGYSTSITASDQIRVGNTSVTSIGGFQSWTTLPSDARFKTNVKENVPGLAFITKLRPVTYLVDIEAIQRYVGITSKAELSAATAQVRTGFIAQEVEKAAQDLRFEFDGVDKPKNEKDLYGLRYAEFTVPLVKAVQELDAENKRLLELLQKQCDSLTTMQARLEALEAKSQR